MSRTRGRALRPGERVELLVRCDDMHLWLIRGTVADDGKGISCGRISEPGGPDDPTCCPECGMPFTATYAVLPVKAKAEVPA